jgi:hypothetical protein
MTSETPAAVTMTVRQWQYIDAVIDNTVAVAAVDGPRKHVRRGQAVRQAGWDQLAPGGGDWPADDLVIAVTLPPALWGFIAKQLDRWADVEEQDDGGETDGQNLRDLRQLVLGQLPA